MALRSWALYGCQSRKARINWLAYTSDSHIKLLRQWCTPSARWLGCCVRCPSANCAENGVKNWCTGTSSRCALQNSWSVQRSSAEVNSDDDQSRNHSLRHAVSNSQIPEHWNNIRRSGSSLHAGMSVNRPGSRNGHWWVRSSVWRKRDTPNELIDVAADT